jgi:hypothetical protein
MKAESGNDPRAYAVPSIETVSMARSVRERAPSKLSPSAVELRTRTERPALAGRAAEAGNGSDNSSDRLPMMRKRRKDLDIVLLLILMAENN